MKILQSMKIRLPIVTVLSILALSTFSSVTALAGNASVPGSYNSTPSYHLFQLDPGARNYVLETFTIKDISLEVLVTKTESGRYQALKEYWLTNQDMLAALDSATDGAAMSMRGTSYSGLAPTEFANSMRMQAAVNWEPLLAPEELSWVYLDRKNNTYICIKFQISGTPGERKISSITWSIAAQAAPRPGTYILPAGTKYSFIYRKAPVLPAGFSWYGVTVFPGS